MLTARCAMLGIILAVTSLAGCGPSDGKTEVNGTITFNGTPISRGSIELEPADGKGQLDGADIVDGKFTVRTTEGAKKVRVRAEKQVGMSKPTDRNPTPYPIYFQYLPVEFNENTTQTATIDGSTLQLDLKGEDLSPADVKETPAQRARRAAQGGQDAR